MARRSSDKQEPGTPTAAGFSVDPEPTPSRPMESALVSSSGPLINVSSDAAQVLVEALFAGSHQEIPRLRHAIAYKLAAGESGGDIVDVYHYDNDCVSFAIADISGKGNRAAVQAAMIKYGLRTLASNGLIPETVMRGLNRLYLENSAFEKIDDSFASVFFGTVDASRRYLTYSNAGHEPVFLLDGKRSVRVLLPTAPVVGVFDDQHHLFKQGVLEIDDESFLVAATDGITEARNRHRELYGMQRLIDAARSGGDSEADVARAILSDCLDFCDGKPHDDIAILVCRCLSPATEERIAAAKHG